MSRLNIKRYDSILDETSQFVERGYVTEALGLTIEGYCSGAKVGSICELRAEDGGSSCEAEVVGIRGDKVILMPLGGSSGVGMGSTIQLKKATASIPVGPELLGRVLDGLGRPIDGLAPIECDEEFLLYSRPLNPLKRARIAEPLDVGVRAINSLLTIGKGMRLGIMAGSGVGKSVLMGMMAKSTTADVNVIALVGERGREVREFVEEILGPEGLAKSIVVCATSDVPPLIRMRSAFVATTIAEYFRAQGKNVLLMMDSVTRFAMAQREVGLAAGEPPTTKGYPPSVFTTLPKIFERVGSLESGGSITGIYTVLTEMDDANDVIGDAVRSIVDGHIVLSRKLAAKNHFPAIDVPLSTSRVMPNVASDEQGQLARQVKAILAHYADAEDLINIGAYVRGTNKDVDFAIKHIEPIRQFLKQSAGDPTDFESSVQAMAEIFKK